VIRLERVFSPLGAVLILYCPLLLLYLVSSDAVFETDFSSRKAFTWAAFGYFGLAILLFAAGAAVGKDRGARRPWGGLGRRGAQPLSRARKRSLTVLIETALVLSLVAYAVWFLLGIIRAGGVGAVLATWRDHPHAVKNLFATVPGVTTLTQLAVAAVPLAVAYGIATRGALARKLVVAVFVLAVFRAVFIEERLALIELLVPLAYLKLAPRRLPVTKVWVAAIAVLVAAVSFFAITELRRTYVYTHDFSAGRVTTRFFGYYLTSINNGFAMIDDYPGRTPAYSTAEFLWQFPVLSDLRVDELPGVGTVSVRYSDLAGVDPPEFWPGALYVQGLSPEYNVFSTPGYLAADFGWFGLAGLFVLGFVSGLLYRRAPATPFHRALYGVWLVGLLEFMRTYYFTNTRVFPAYLLFLAAYLVLRQPTGARVPLRRPLPSTAGLGEADLKAQT
jgi:oligosaccharide repeat unit polymerase